MHGPDPLRSESDGRGREGILDGAHRFEEAPRARRDLASELPFHDLREGVREDRGRLERGGLRHEESVPGPRHVRGDPAVSRRDGEEGCASDHGIGTSLVPACVAGDDRGPVSAALAIDDPQHRLDLIVLDVHRKIPVHRHILRRHAGRCEVRGQDVEGEPRGPLPSVLGHDVDRVRRRDHRPAVREPHHADVDAVRGAHRDVLPPLAQVPCDDGLEEGSAHLAHRILPRHRVRHRR